jgi:hypothetical protein
MSFAITHVFGDTESNPPMSCLENLLAELNDADEEHTDVSVKHESEWCLSAFPDGSLIWENVASEGVPRHMTNVPKVKIIELWMKLARGDIDLINSEPWLEGYY